MRVVNYFGTPPGICVLSLAHGYELRGSDVYLQIVKKNDVEIFLSIQPGYVRLEGLC